MMTIARREILGLGVAATTMAATPGQLWAESYPARPVHIVSCYPAAASPDILARIIADALSRRIGQQFIVADRPGAGSNIGTEVVAHAAPDGYTLLMAVSTN